MSVAAPGESHFYKPHTIIIIILYSGSLIDSGGI